MRYPALEGLRGLAALVVVIHHHLLVLPAVFPYATNATGLLAVLLYSPVHLVWAGGEAVLLFFMLSGFVLSLSTWQGRPLQMPEFIIKRIWRIWVPCIMAVTLAFGAAKLIGPNVIVGASSWFNSIWQDANWNTYVDHLLMLGKMDQYNQAFIPVVWSLKWEMWGSLLLPLVILIARQNITIVIASSALALAWYWQAGGGSEVHEGLLRFLPMFVLGAMLAYHRIKITNMIEVQTKLAQMLLLVLALLLIPFQWYDFSESTSYIRIIFNDYATLGGTALLIALVLGCSNIKNWFEHPFLIWLGRISFSMYLYHAFLLTIIVRLGASYLPIPILLAISFTLIFPVAHLAYERIERPAMGYGKKLQLQHTKRISGTVTAEETI